MLPYNDILTMLPSADLKIEKRPFCPTFKLNGPLDFCFTIFFFNYFTTKLVPSALSSNWVIFYSEKDQI